MGVCRVLPVEANDGPTNMALDEALLDSVADDPASAALRLYTWSEPSLSLGYFQPIAWAEAEPRWRGVPIVRRPSGGGALWHDAEVTYAVVIPRDHPLARRTADLYRAVHDAIARLLTSIGLDAQRRGELETSDGAEKPFLCFADRDAEDVVVGRAKLVGSAQRRRAGAVLQHGSVLLGGSRVTPELPGAVDLAGIPLDLDAWAQALAGAIPPALGLDPVASALTAEERARADRLAEGVYRNPAWTRKR
jgi:lipoate-protein ligase A